MPRCAPQVPGDALAACGIAVRGRALLASGVRAALGVALPGRTPWTRGRRATGGVGVPRCAPQVPGDALAGVRHHGGGSRARAPRCPRCRRAGLRTTDDALPTASRCWCEHCERGGRAPPACRAERSGMSSPHTASSCRGRALRAAATPSPHTHRGAAPGRGGVPRRPRDAVPRRAPRAQANCASQQPLGVTVSCRAAGHRPQPRRPRPHGAGPSLEIPGRLSGRTTPEPTAGSTCPRSRRPPRCRPRPAAAR